MLEPCKATRVRAHTHRKLLPNTNFGLWKRDWTEDTAQHEVEQPPPPPLPPFFLPTIYFITLTIYICRAILRAALLLVGLAPVGQNFMRNIGLLINKGKRIVEGEEEQHSDTVHPGIFNFVQELLIAFWVDKVYATTIEKRLWQWRNKEQP